MRKRLVQRSILIKDASSHTVMLPQTAHWQIEESFLIQEKVAAAGWTSSKRTRMILKDCSTVPKL